MTYAAKDKVFVDTWVNTNTNIGKLNPYQVRKLRALCRNFFNKGFHYGLVKREKTASGTPREPGVK